MESIENTIISLANEGVFGTGQCIRVIPKYDTSNKGEQYASAVKFATVIINNGHDVVEIPIVIKEPLPNTFHNSIIHSGNLFWTEMFMYKSVLPFLEADRLKLFPKMYYGNAKRGQDSEDDLIILEDLTPLNYKIAKEKLHLDYDHIVLTLKKLAEFHALSYIKKKQDEFNFHTMAENLTYSKFFTKNKKLQQFFSLSIIRSINLLIESDEENNDILRKFKDKVLNFAELAISLIKPEEPFAVICHGDFCRNNVIYKYNENGKPIDMKFFDLQTSIYTNPAVELSFLLYMNTNAELRAKYWDEFLQIYWNTLYNMMPNIDFNFNQFMEHFSKRAIFGLIPTSFFVPVVNEDLRLFVDSFNDSMEVRAAKILNVGNKETCQILLDVTKHMLEKKYFHKFIEFL